MILTIGDFKLVTDPTFDPPGSYEASPNSGRYLEKSCGPALTEVEAGAADAVLLSHDQHVDNLDTAGRNYALSSPLILTTPEAAERLGPPAIGLRPWEETMLTAAGGSTLEVTAVPAQHGPDGTEHLTGPVTGFVLRARGLPSIYISGDNASLHLVRDIADRFDRLDVAVIFAGAAKSALLGDHFLTLSSAEAAEAALTLGARHVVPAHFNSWSHFTEDADCLAAAFDAAGLTDRVSMLAPGDDVAISSYEL
jgi:L-ascorbate metabolism protein UlaG (beta-lactamase superfamily)